MFKKQLKRLFTISLVAVVTSAVSAGGVARPIEIRAIAMPDATMEQLARNHVDVSNVARPPEHRRPFVAASFPSNSITASVALPPTGPAPPPATLTFAASGSEDLYPADASGAVSRQQVVGAFNTGLTVQERNGKYLQRISLSLFWQDPALATGTTYDPRIVYDRVNDRWVLACLNETSSKSTLLLAVSQNGDAAGAWRRFQIPLSPLGLFGDFTRLALTSDRIAVTLNDYDVGAALFTVPKSDAYDPSATSLTVTRVNFRGIDVTPVENADPGDARLRVIVMAAGSSVAMSDIVDGREANIVAYNSPILYNIDPPFLVGRQLGSTTLMDAGPAMVHYAVSRKGTTWVVQTVGMPVGGNSKRAAILIWRISGGSARVNLLDSGSDAISVSYPSIAVNRLGGALVAYSLFDPSRYASAAYVYIDPFGDMSTQAIVKSGIASFEPDRWGDYTSTVVDPIDDIGFWTVQVYPTNFGLVHKTPDWTTYWSQFTLPPVRRRSAHH